MKESLDAQKGSTLIITAENKDTMQNNFKSQLGPGFKYYTNTGKTEFIQVASSEDEQFKIAVKVIFVYKKL